MDSQGKKFYPAGNDETYRVGSSRANCDALVLIAVQAFTGQVRDGALRTQP